jgi:hypothetical protein
MVFVIAGLKQTDNIHYSLTTVMETSSLIRIVCEPLSASATYSL